jgi:hypothetical protein
MLSPPYEWPIFKLPFVKCNDSNALIKEGGIFVKAKAV